MTQFEEEKQKKKLAQLLRKEEEGTVEMLSEKYGVPYLNLQITPINIDALKIVSEEEARKAEIAVFQKIGKRIEVAVRNPQKPETAALLEKIKERSFVITLRLVSKTSLEKAWEFYRQIQKEGAAITGQIQVSDIRLQELQQQILSVRDIAPILAELSKRRITDTLEAIIAGALKTETSDVHLEPQEDAVRIRYRLDGVLADIAGIQRNTFKLLLSRIKLISELKLNVTAKGQDGRFTIRTGETDIEVRTSTLPGPYGENVVLRILNPKTIGLSMEHLGMQPWVRAVIEKELKKPNGMILTTGPTGSGKTTTLYAFLKRVHREGIKIITIEDPIEYHLKGVEQTQVEPERGYDFASALSFVLRQDPDVILVGEIRNRETAETAMHASLTGHLVFSTLHTNSAAGTIPRLIDMEVKPNIVAPAINIAMAQRLLRRLCEKCRTSAPASAEERRTIEQELAAFPKGVEKPDIKTLSLFHPAGCPTCNSTGYKSRVGVYEVILIDDRLETLIFKNPSEVEIKKAALEQGQITMRQDSILKVIAGITDLNEVERVVGGGKEG